MLSYHRGHEGQLCEGQAIRNRHLLAKWIYFFEGHNSNNTCEVLYLSCEVFNTKILKRNGTCLFYKSAVYMYRNDRCEEGITVTRQCHAL